jgi:hypothetical protein
MALEQFANNALTTLSGSITNVATTLVVTSATNFPATGNFRIGVDTGSNFEYMLVTNVAGTTFTVTRGQESTTNVAHNSGVVVTHILTAGGLVQTLNDNVGFPTVPGLRLSLTTVTPVTTSDVTGATTLYYTPYTSGSINLFNGTVWTPYTTGEVSLALGTLTNNTNYDVFATYSSGVVLHILAWSSDTARATALVRQNGAWVLSGTTSYLYIGTFRTTATTTTEDSIANRYVYNWYNKTPRKLKVISSVNSWVYGTAAYRQADGSTANQYNYVAGDPGGADALTTRVVAVVSSNGGTLNASLGVGIDSTTVNSADLYGDNIVSANVVQLQGVYDGYPGIGKHTIAWLEYASGTSTFYGNIGVPLVFQGGMTGLVWQ